MAAVSGIIRTDTDGRISTLWDMGTQMVRAAPPSDLSHAKNEFAQGVAFLMDSHPDAVEQASAIVDRLFEAAQKAGPPRPHPIMWGTLVAFVGLLVTVIGGAMKFSSDYGILHEQVMQLQQQMQQQQPRLNSLETRQIESEKAWVRIEQKIDDLKRDLERR